jgi:hypothetical protein
VCAGGFTTNEEGTVISRPFCFFVVKARTRRDVQSILRQRITLVLPNQAAKLFTRQPHRFR